MTKTKTNAKTKGNANANTKTSVIPFLASVRGFLLPISELEREGQT